MIPARFQLPVESKVMGCLMYITIIPVVSVFIMLLLFLAVFGVVQWVGLPEQVSMVFGLVAFPLILIWVVRFAARDFRRRAGMEVVIDHDRIELTVGGKHREIPLEEIDSVRLVRVQGNMACILRLVSRERIRLPEEIAPYSHLLEPLEATLIPHLADRIPSRLGEEQEISLRESEFMGLWLMIRGVMSILFGILLYLSIVLRMGGLPLILGGWLSIGQGRLARRGGFVVRPDGVVPKRSFGDWLVPWSEIVSIRRNDCGILLQASDGTEISTSSLTHDWWPVARWIEDVCAKDSERLNQETGVRQ